MSARKTALTDPVKVRLTAAEKDLLRRTATRLRVDMSVWCRSVIVEALTSEQQRRDDLLAYQQQLSLMTDHIIRVRALLNADIASRYPDEGAAVAQAADALQAQLTGMEMADNE